MKTSKLFQEKKGVEYSYSSTQINLPSSFAREFMKWGKGFIDPNDVYEDPEDDSYGMENDIHSTVLYGIHEQKPILTRKVTRKTKPFVITLGDTAIFETSDDYDVVKIDVHGNALKKLHYAIRAKVPNTNKFPEYHPHCTIGYVKKGKGKEYSGDDEFEGRRFKVNAILFSSRNGGKYRLKLGELHG